MRSRIELDVFQRRREHHISADHDVSAPVATAVDANLDSPILPEDVVGDDEGVGSAGGPRLDFAMDCFDIDTVVRLAVGAVVIDAITPEDPALDSGADVDTVFLVVADVTVLDRTNGRSDYGRKPL